MKFKKIHDVQRLLQHFNLYPVDQPDFFILGTQKGGTTALYHSLKSHPNVVAPIRKKELHFFDKIDELTTLNVQAYQREFHPNWLRMNRKTFDATPMYMYDARCPSLIHAYAPEAKLIFFLSIIQN